MFVCARAPSEALSFRGLYSFGLCFTRVKSAPAGFVLGWGSAFVGRHKGRRWRDGFLYAAAGTVFVLAAVMGYFYAGATLERIYTSSMRTHADFETFWYSARAFLDGEDVYRTGYYLNNLNPPLWVLLTVPFGLLEPLSGYRLFAGLTAALQAAALAWMLRELRPVGARSSVLGALAVVALLISSPLLATLALGQMYQILTFGLVAAWVLDRRGRGAASGCALGLVVTLKPSLAPVVLWPLVRRRWDALGATIMAGAAATLVGALALGPATTVEWVNLLRNEPLSPYWDNASLPAAAARLFTEHEFNEPLAPLPLMVPLFQTLGIVLVFLTAYRAQSGAEAGLWALVAASLLASPIAWHNYLVLLAPGILLLLVRGRAGAAALLVALQLIPAQWPLLWREGSTIGGAVGPEAAALGLTFYLYVLAVHWAAFYGASRGLQKGTRGTIGAEVTGRPQEGTTCGVPQGKAEDNEDDRPTHR